jgi:hypothetical protein
MARKRMRSQTEWLVRLDEAGSENVHSVVVYRLLTSLDSQTGLIVLRKLLVAARGYSGGGIYESYSGVMYPEGEQYRLVDCHYAYPDPEDFHELERDYVTQKDRDVLRSLWDKADRLTDFDPDLQSFTAKVSIYQESECSDEWDGDLLIQISERWALFLYFRDYRSRKLQRKQPIVSLCARPEGVSDDE